MALALGCTVEELLSRISSRELTEWMVYYQLEPWGGERADVGAAIVASTIAEIHRNPKKRARPYKASDFMPRFERPKQQSVSDMRSMLESWVGRWG